MGKPRTERLMELLESMPPRVSVHKLGEEGDAHWTVSFYDEHGEICEDHDNPMSNNIDLVMNEPDLVRALLLAKNRLVFVRC